MFLKYLKIENEDGFIRQVNFRLGMNLIVDDTEGKTSDSGNNVGKTTLLYLIDYCLGGKDESIYKSPDKNINRDVRDFLKESNVEVELCLADSLLHEKSRTVTIRRNFLTFNKAIRLINGRKVAAKDFEYELAKEILDIEPSVPTYRQIISHSLRIDDLRLAQPLQTFPTSFGKKIEYEALHLFMFGASKEEAVKKVTLSREMFDDDSYRKRLEKDAKGNLSSLKSQLALVEKDIERLNAQKASLKLNPDFESDINRLTFLRGRMSQLGLDLSALQLRRSLIEDASKEMKSMYSKADAEQVEMVYKQASAFNEKLHHTFSELLAFHNGMLDRRVEFVENELPQLNKEISNLGAELKMLRDEEWDLQTKLNLSVSYETFDEMITKLSELNQQYGELSKSVKQLEGVADSLYGNSEKLDEINSSLQSKEWQATVQEQLNKFNVHFADISRKLYGNEYIAVFDIVNYKGKPCYQFRIEARNSFGSGKKQGEISCFDLAYIQFAEEEDIPCLNFNLYDKMELVHGNQLGIIAELVEKMTNVQEVVAILKDKLPTDMDVNKYVVERLTENDRLFRMEGSTWYKKNHPEEEK